MAKMKKLIASDEFKLMKNRSIIVGLTYIYKDNSISHRVQFSAVISGLDNRGLIIKKNNGEEFILPPDMSAYQKAPEGEYTIKTTGEVVINPDYMTTWTIGLNED